MQRPQRTPQSCRADVPAQLGAQFFERGIRLLADQGGQLLHVLNQLDRLPWTRFSGCDLASLATLLFQPTHPSEADLVLYDNGQRSHSRIVIRQNSFTQINGIRLHGNSLLELPPSLPSLCRSR